MKKLVNLVVIIMMFVLPLIISSTASAGFFGATTYEECVLDNIKGLNNAEAVQMLKNTCATKFPPLKLKNPPNSYRIDASRGASARVLVDNLSILKRYPLGIEIMNKNSFSIEGIYVGVLANGLKFCPASEKDFESIHWCRGVVGANQTGLVICKQHFGTVCFTGFATEWLDDPEKFFKETGIKGD